VCGSSYGGARSTGDKEMFAKRSGAKRTSAPWPTSDTESASANGYAMNVLKSDSKLGDHPVQMMSGKFSRESRRCDLTERSMHSQYSLAAFHSVALGRMCRRPGCLWRIHHHFQSFRYRAQVQGQFPNVVVFDQSLALLPECISFGVPAEGTAPSQHRAISPMLRTLFPQSCRSSPKAPRSPRTPQRPHLCLFPTRLAISPTNR
jgi:hypothetical protein